ncbi:restriction endonuclease subunit S [Lactococcus lactis subsp. cremoris]|uniref:Restriction endonuclease subunit S n=1 Tax=Lactococcus lactis subsp. lactis TaxID=1360 RepID=A0AAC9QZD2_LACLL|nr:restriction endonuclease subunit S [Lactococcus lactis]MRM76562.1 restriction endonuclease subunit S [Lactococcus cremoris]ARD94809.2 restriction endonuclease subunit S [Lactococcus lactis subsp. lactis]MRK42635.1 restriction endonuclease subunit S [Lactococcus lactis subsp. lactis]MRM79558.1 restriction endonuclease subunit S [Lactococcus cremoris]WKF45830.1 restriction endonuclease subunit S [Lactococcus lactis subsp. lactis]
MMSKKSPQLRFEGFTDDWELRKLGELLTEVKRPIKMQDDDTYQLVTVKRRNEGIVSRGFFKGRQILVKNYFELHAGDYLISKRQVVHGANGIVPKDMEGAIVSNEYLVSVGNKNITTDFLTIISKLPIMYKMFFLSSYGIDIEKLVFNVKDWKKREISIPSLQEQDRISSFFKQLDDTIVLHQRKLDLLKEQKKGYLQKMFPKNGAKVPELRFAGFADDWEERKLVSMTNYKNGKGHEDKQSTIGKFELINLNSISISGGLKHSGKFIDEADDTLQKDDLVMILSDVGHGDLLGRVALIPEDDRFVLNQRVALLRPNATADPQFLFSYINAHQYYFKAQGAGMSQLNISKGSVENFISFVPIIEEQKKIGTFFKQLDNTITLHQRKLDLLKEQKKGFLQKMFV